MVNDPRDKSNTILKVLMDNHNKSFTYRKPKALMDDMDDVIVKTTKTVSAVFGNKMLYPCCFKVI
jgi:hypothetical protein